MIICIFIILLICLALYLFLITPARTDPAAAGPLLHRYYAHRGLYEQDQSIAENTLPAFQRAAEHGYGIELDIQFSKDGKIVVFHDDTLERACSISKRVDEVNWDELSSLPLFGQDAHIPLFTDVLSAVDGRVPLIVELKAGRRNRDLCEQSWELLKVYSGPFCIESFDPRIVRWFRTHAPKVIRGQLACSRTIAAETTPRFLAFAAEKCFLNFLSRPNFIAYQLKQRPLSVRLSERLGAMPVCWTSHGLGDEHGQKMVIFEFYHPPVSFAES